MKMNQPVILKKIDILMFTHYLPLCPASLPRGDEKGSIQVVLYALKILKQSAIITEIRSNFDGVSGIKHYLPS
ncbi:hypothetical protein SAMN05443144_101151 [Fodinibius roseus]|uniref:Uncharacterized protein n=1 Tax=Fodinibius roseus TaxID=1194090 RepID=A0A1M4SXU1_9BACT|nr:hypothetical protein SAMN05443144_101151 [Fodinibius roseus]